MGTNRLIDGYLHELDAAIAPLAHRARRRIMIEARDHLLDAADEVGEAGAIQRFGPADKVGAAHVGAASVAAPRRAVVAFASGGIGYGLIQALAAPPTFGLFPPGPWPNDQPPPHLAWKVDLAGALIMVAFLIGVAAMIVAWRQRHLHVAERALAVRLAFIGSIVFAASWPFEAIFLFQRAHEVAGSPRDAVVGLVTAGLLGFSIFAVLIANRSRRLVDALTN